MTESVIVRAPVRVSFGGGGTDLETYYARFGGFVVSAAITRYCYVVADEPDDHGIHLNSADYHTWQSFGRGELPAVREPLSLPKAAIEAFAPHGLREVGVDLFLSAEVPPGTGLGSSSAMAVALTRGLAAYLHVPHDVAEVAERACALEIDRLAMPIGKQDQYASAYGGLNAISFTAERTEVTPLNLPADVVAALSARLLLFATGQSRHSAQILHQQRTDTAIKPGVIQSLHRLKELAEEMCRALSDQDLDRFGHLLDLGWQHKRRLSGRISSSSIDRFYAAAREAGALGGKITGAGGGGFLLLYCPPRHQWKLRVAMEQLGLRELPFAFDFAGAQLLTRPERERAWESLPSTPPNQIFAGRWLRRSISPAPPRAGKHAREEGVNHAS